MRKSIISLFLTALLIFAIGLIPDASEVDIGPDIQTEMVMDVEPGETYTYVQLSTINTFEEATTEKPANQNILNISGPPNSGSDSIAESIYNYGVPLSKTYDYLGQVPAFHYLC